jgi:hypothetical protein
MPLSTCLALNVHPERTRRPPLFSPEEHSRLRGALRTAHGQFGTWAALGAALCADPAHVARTVRRRRHVAAALAVRLARVLRRPLESLTGGCHAQNSH